MKLVMQLVGSLLMLFFFAAMYLLAQETVGDASALRAPKDVFPAHAAQGHRLQVAVEPGHPGYRLVASWNVNKQPPAAAIPRHRDDLLAVAVDFPGSGSAMDRDIVLDITTATDSDKPLVRSALRFFWQPRFVDKAGSINPTVDQGENPSPRLELIIEPLRGLKGFTPDTPSYEIVNQVGFLPVQFAAQNMRSTGLSKLLDVWRQIAAQRTGRVQLLIEEGVPPEYLFIIWLPNGRPWGKPKLVCPALPGMMEPEVVELFPTLAGQGNVARLPKGTWDLLRLAKVGQSGGLTIVGLGKEGLVVGSRADEAPHYEAHLLRDKGGNREYKPVPIVSEGLSRRPPPVWTSYFQPRYFTPQQGWEAKQARHLVALTVCSPAVWRTERNPPGETAEYLSRLFADPELWALPK